MSYSAIVACSEPQHCEVCGKELVDGDNVVQCLVTEYNYLPNGELYENAPEYKWATNLDWHDDYMVHTICMLNKLHPEQIKK